MVQTSQAGPHLVAGTNQKCGARHAAVSSTASLACDAILDYCTADAFAGTPIRGKLSSVWTTLPNGDQIRTA
jgi:hypothetical protein